MNERLLTSGVLDLSASLGLLTHHCPDSRRCTGPKGFPDIFVAGPHGSLLAELKSADGDTSADQDRWLWTLHRSGTPFALWRPEHLHSGVIRAALESLA